MCIETLVEGKIPVKALIDTSPKFNTISKRLFNKLKLNYRIRLSCGSAECLYGDVIGEINCLDLRFRYKGKWQSLDDTNTIYFKIRKNLTSYDPYAKIVIDGMNIPLIGDNNRPTGDSLSHNTSPIKNDPSRSDLLIYEIMNMIKKILSVVEDNKH
ncbi:11117_t:CDS:2 [Funneliformis caledonium]|uniref:11117_t:CDS:1 n=1 Tax=Funneliformis caledonium TaxID=1117310 RepID=A0A9N9D6G1_9GLOM|nr:11117_t:CDS:2 [Funneliformis caledonium]